MPAGKRATPDNLRTGRQGLFSEGLHTHAYRLLGRNLLATAVAMTMRNTEPTTLVATLVRRLKSAVASANPLCCSAVLLKTLSSRGERHGME
jgi:hypothetical protein